MKDNKSNKKAPQGKPAAKQAPKPAATASKKK